MKKVILIVSMALAGVALADPSYWAAAYTEAAKSDKSGGTAVARYSGYYCSVEAAAQMFEGNDTVATLTDYFANTKNFKAGWKALEDASGTGAGAVGRLGASLIEYDHEQYALNSTYGESLADFGSSYLAVLVYDDINNPQFRVMASDADELSAYGNAYFSDDGFSSSGDVGAWKTIPEPTSALLMLLGVAGLALRRRRA